ncbi:MAG: PEP-CTERM sorting domain-containing protein [Bacteriovorax sp.]|nr:PEP-CTERM sorting domain-containing protein [Rhizobacter sp.]
MKITRQLLACALPLAVVCASALADEGFCDRYSAGPHPTYWQCAQASAAGDTRTVITPDQGGGGPVAASQVGLNNGSGSFARASASASPGVLRGIVSAEMVGNFYDDQSSARADAWFYDAGTAIGAPGALIGDPVSLRFTLDVDGSFSGGKPFQALSEATAELFVLSGKGIALHTWTLITKADPHSLSWSDIAGFRVGDSFDLFMKLHIAANASGHSLDERASFADVSHTGHLYVDVLSGNASVVGANGHLYATSAPVPEPATFSLFAIGLAGLLWTARKRGGHLASDRTRRGAVGLARDADCGHRLSALRP